MYQAVEDQACRRLRKIVEQIFPVALFPAPLHVYAVRVLNGNVLQYWLKSLHMPRYRTMVVSAEIGKFFQLDPIGITESTRTPVGLVCSCLQP